jgi:uncharacterized protein (TIGR02147 family)
VSAEDKAALLRGVPEKRLRYSYKLADPYVSIKSDTFHVIAEWYHFGILSLSETKDFENSPRWIARRLGITTKEARSSLQRLMRLGLLREMPDGRIRATHRKLTTTDGIKDLVLQRCHKKNLALAGLSLERDDFQDRDFASITLSVNRSKIPQARRLIRKFRDRISQCLEVEPKDEVYKLCIQLFPITKLKK